MPNVSQFKQSIYTVKLDYGFDEPVIVEVRPFADLESYIKELDDLQDDDAGRLKLYNLVCGRLSDWQNVRDNIPAFVEDLSSIPSAYRSLYKEAEGHIEVADGEPVTRYFLDGNPHASPREVDIPLNPQSLLEFKFDFTIAMDIVKRAVQEVDTKKKRGGRN